MQFTYIKDNLPEIGIAVMAAWTNQNEDEFHVAPSMLDTSHSHWITQDGFFNQSDGWHVYAWADWPDAPELPLRAHIANPIIGGILGILLEKRLAERVKL